MVSPMYVNYQSLKREARAHASTIDDHLYRLEFARSFCKVTVEAYWQTLLNLNGSNLEIIQCPLHLPIIPEKIERLAIEIGSLIPAFPPEDAGFLIGSVYTAMLPNALRSKHGAYYTPPPLIDRLISLAVESGVDFTTAKVIDPACGGGAFLAPIALKMIDSLKGQTSTQIVSSINTRLHGIELDPFAAWISHVLLESVILPHCVKAGVRLDQVIQIGDALSIEQGSEYDLIIGNPPYGKISLDTKLRTKYSRSLFGHANLYGLFVDLSLRIRKENGVIALITPTSFLGGQYFKNLRSLLSSQVNALYFEFVKDRHGVFEDVLQETILTTYVSLHDQRKLEITELLPEGLNAFKLSKIGEGKIIAGSSPWFLPRDASDVVFLNKVMSHNNRFNNIGFEISTGPLVWNQHKPMLNHYKDGLPLIWAHHVTPRGFEHNQNPLGHGDHVKLIPDKEHLVTRKECVLVKRTTSKEQARRILATVLPSSFISNAGGAYVENHLNIIMNTPVSDVSLESIAALLNSKVIDRIFRCTNGSTAVSAYELNALPLPPTGELKMLEGMVHDGLSGKDLESAIEKAYGLS